MDIRVSVVVAVWNPGAPFEELVASLLRQTLPAEQFEVWFCDDGSDEDTRARLQEISAEHPHLKTILLPHSGWPGTPRNAGIDAARGTYVFFADHDDHFGDDALRTMVEHADAWGSDVLVPRLTRVGRRPSMLMFAADVPDARLGVDPLLDFLTPHKLFRTSLLREHGIRFPDGRVRLEDHLLVVRAYFAARVVSILASYPCYYWTYRRRSASDGRLDPETYYAHLGAVLDVVEASTEPGELRDRLLAHWYAGKVLDRVGAGLMANYPDEYRHRLLDVLEPFVTERIPPSADRWVPFPKRVRSALLRAGERDALLRLARLDAQVRVRAYASEIGWSADGRLVVTATVDLRLADGSAYGLVTKPDGSVRWDPPVALPPEVVTPELLDATGDVADDVVVVLVRDVKDSTDSRVPDEDQERLPDAPLRVRSSIDTRTARLGRPVARRSELGVDGYRAGWRFTDALLVEEDVLADAGPPRRVGRRLLTLGRGKQGQLTLTAVRVPEPTPTPAAPPTGWDRVVRGLRRRGRALAAHPPWSRPEG